MTSIHDSEFTLDKLYDKVDRSISQFPYSAAHVQEVDNYQADNQDDRDSFIAKRLEKIQEITNGLYLYQELSSNKVYFLTEKPTTVLEIIRQVPFGKTAMQSFVNLIPSHQKIQLRETLGIETMKLNNYKPDEVVGHLNTKLTNWGTNDTFIELIEKSIELHPDGKSFGLHNRIAGIFELLDLFGYWKDRETSTSNYARLWDSNHTHFASYCDYFISDDKRTRNKAKVVYGIYGIQTKIISSDGKE
jgi:hypothetical protein